MLGGERHLSGPDEKGRGNQERAKVATAARQTVEGRDLHAAPHPLPRGANYRPGCVDGGWQAALLLWRVERMSTVEEIHILPERG
jgi:hypothetical protein